MKTILVYVFLVCGQPVEVEWPKNTKYETMYWESFGKFYKTKEWVEFIKYTHENEFEVRFRKKEIGNKYGCV